VIVLGDERTLELVGAARRRLNEEGLAGAQIVEPIGINTGVSIIALEANSLEQTFWEDRR
jgi:hypothetical protein